MRLTADTDQDAMAAHVASTSQRAALRLSEARADRLQRNARIRTGRWDLTVRLERTHPPATLLATDSGPEIVVSGDAVPQPVTDYPPEEWDLLVQKVRVMHELGHLAHSNPADLRERLAGLPDGWTPVAGQIWNAFEDAVIEAAISEQWPNYGHWFQQVRHNLIEGTGPGIADPTGGRVYPMVHAIVLGILDRALSGTGTLDALLDPAAPRHHFYTDADRERFEREVLPGLVEATADIGGISDASDRNRRVMEFVETVRPAIEAADADGRGQVAARAGDPAATRVRGNVAGSGGDAWGMPDDASGAIGCEGAAVETLSQDDQGGVGGPEGGRDHVAGAMLTGPDQGEDATSNAREDDQADPAGADQEQAAIEDQPGTDAIDEELSRALAEEIADQQRQDSTQQDARMENLEQLQAAVEAAETEVESEGVVLPDDDPVPDEETAAAAREDGERLAQVLRNRFQKERKRSLLRNQRRGRLDPAAIHRHATGEKLLKHRRETPDETDHHCLFVLDRSGSMRQHIRVAERAMGMLVFALEAVDVDVGVLELLDKEVRLAKAVDREASRATPRLFHGEATGGTPLTDTLHIARERLKQETGNRFLFVVTDGLPSDPERYRDALNRFPVPVVGVNLTTDRAAGESEFHRQVTVPPETGELRRALRQLVQEVLFE